MTGRRNSRRNQKRYDAFLLTTAVAFGAIVTAHYWAIVLISITLIGIAYVAGRTHSRKARVPQRRTTKDPRVAHRKIHTVRLSSECAGNDHLICTDKRCDCSRCDHPALKSYPLPADRVPAVYPDTPPF